MSIIAHEHFVPAPKAGFLRRWFERRVAIRRQRDAVERLDRHLLNDIGIGPNAPASKAARPVWNAPAHWFK